MWGYRTLTPNLGLFNATEESIVSLVSDDPEPVEVAPFPVCDRAMRAADICSPDLAFFASGPATGDTGSLRTRRTWRRPALPRSAEGICSSPKTRAGQNERNLTGVAGPHSWVQIRRDGHVFLPGREAASRCRLARNRARSEHPTRHCHVQRATTGVSFVVQRTGLQWRAESRQGQIF